MPEIPRTKFNSPWTVANIEAALNDVSSAKGSSESLTAALNAMRAEINSLSGGVHLKGAVDYYNDLPASPTEGDAYTVRYQGASGTDPLGIEYAWATYQGTPQWIPIGVDPSVFAKQTEMDVVANAGAKNLLNVKLAENYRAGQEGSFPITTGNVTFSENGGVIATSGTASATLTLRVPIYLPIGTYYISGSPASGSDTTYRTDLREQGANVMISSNRDYGSGFEVEITTARTVDWCIRIQSGFDATGLTFSPMIRPAAITDPTYQPFARTNRDLTVLTDEDRTALVEIVDGGAKNVRNITLDELQTLGANAEFSWSGNVATKNNVSFTINTDGTITVNAEQAASAQVILDIYRMPSDASNMVLSGTPAGGSADSYFQYVKGTAFRDYGGGVLYSKTGAHSIGLVIASGYRPQNLTFKPMICTKAAWDISHAFQPYRPSWQEMWYAIQALQSGGNRALTMQTELEEQEER